MANVAWRLKIMGTGMLEPEGTATSVENDYLVFMQAQVRNQSSIFARTALVHSNFTLNCPHSEGQL